MCGHKPTGSTNKSPRSALSLRSRCLRLSPDDLSSVFLSHSKSLDIDWDQTGVSTGKINKESVAMNSSLTHANMKGRIIICHLFESGHVFLRPLSYKWPLLLPDPQASQVSAPNTPPNTLRDLDDFRWNCCSRTEWLVVLKTNYL